MPLTNFPNGLSSFGIPVLGGAGIPFTGNYWFVDPANGGDGNSGKSPARSFATLYQAYKMCIDGNNDVVFLISRPTTTSASNGTARLSKALAQTIDSTATTGTLTWAKNATHLIGIAAPGGNSRARIAPTTTDTITLFGSGNFVVVTAQSCMFANISVFHGFATGGASQIAWTDSGGRNAYVNCTIQGMGDTGSAASTTGRSLLVSGSVGENTFRGCNIGTDTVPRSTGAVEIEFATNSPRNKFYDCVIETNSAAGADFWIKVGATGLDRYALFDNCTFTNPLLAGAVTLTTGFSCNAAPGGTLLLQNCMTYGATSIDTAGKTFQNEAAATTAGTKAAAGSA